MIKNPVLWLGRKGIPLSVRGMADRNIKSAKEETCMLCFVKRNETWNECKKENVRIVVFSLTYTILVCEVNKLSICICSLLTFYRNQYSNNKIKHIEKIVF